MVYPKNLEEYREKRGPVTTKEFKGVLKAGAKMAAEELLMSVIPVARIGKLAKLVKGLKKGSSRKEVSKALKEGGFDKLASTKPSQSELNRQVKVAQARQQAADATKKAKREVGYSEFSRKLGQTGEDLATRESRTAGRQAKAKMHKARQKRSAARRKRMLGRPKAADLSEVGAEIAEKRAAQIKEKGVSMRSTLGKSPSKERQAKRIVKARKKAKAAEEIEKKVNLLADLSDTIAKNAAKRKKALRKAAEAKAGKGAAAAGRAKAKRTFKTEDGYTFHELADGRVVDNLNLKNVDMDWPSVKAFKKDMGDLL